MTRITRTIRRQTLGADEYAAYVERVNAAAGTDIEILESNWLAALADEDFETAGRIEGFVMRARRAAGY